MILGNIRTKKLAAKVFRTTNSVTDNGRIDGAISIFSSLSDLKIKEYKYQIEKRKKS